MPRRSILSTAECENLLALPDAKDDLIRYYTFSETDLSIIRQHRSPANRLGFAVQLCYLRFPGIILGVDQSPYPPLLRLAADQITVSAESWEDYGQREQTRREHLMELQAWLGLTIFSAWDYRRLVHLLAKLAQQTDRGIVLAETLVELLRQQHIILPAIAVITPILLATLNMKAAPTACELLKAVELLKGMNERQARKVPDDAPTSFVRKRWKSLVYTPDGLDRRFYELCVLSELKNSLRSGDIWVQGSRQFKNFEDYLLPPSRFAAQRAQRELGLAVETDCDRYLETRLAASIRQGTVSASLMLRKLGSYSRQNSLAVALRELGRIERTLFALDWMQNIDLRRRVQIGLNKGEAKNALARAVFLNRLGEIRDRSFENQRYRASGLNLVVSAIVLWNTVYLERAIQALRNSGKDIDEKLLTHLSPLGWEHIILTGDYIWRQNKQVDQDKFRPLRMLGDA
jgi:TnpA family transposase